MLKRLSKLMVLMMLLLSFGLGFANGVPVKDNFEQNNTSKIVAIDPEPGRCIIRNVATIDPEPGRCIIRNIPLIDPEPCRL